MWQSELTVPGISLDPATQVLTFPQGVSLATSTGWMDITPFESGDDGVNGATHTLITGGQPRVYGRRFRGDANQTTNRTYRFHVPHDVAATPTACFFHIHWAHNTVSPTGNARFVIYVNACKRDGTPITEVNTTMLITPLAADCYKINMVREVDLSALTGILAQLQVDALFSVYLERQAGDVADTFNGDIFVRGADLHVQTDGKSTTAKDEGGGWVKVAI